MAPNSSDPTSASQNRVKPFERREILYKNHYFDNELVERLLYEYLEGACTDVPLRDMIMEQASELIRQIIKAHNLAQIYPGRDESSIGDLFQTAWIQIESALYKYTARPHCSKCYNSLRPNDSVLSEEFIFAEEVISKIKRCPRCKVRLERSIIYYKGTSKVFNMWCVNPYTKVITNAGISTLSDAIDKDGMVHGSSGLTEIVGSVRKPEQDTIIINTLYNYALESSPEHFLMKLGVDGPNWVQVKDIKIGDLVGLQCSQQIFLNDNNLRDVHLRDNTWGKPDSITNELAYFSGLYLAEGTYGNNMVHIYNNDTEVVDCLVNNTLGLKFRNIDGNCVTYTCSKSFTEFLDIIGMGHDAKKKTIPSRLLRMSKDNIGALLSGLFDGDGHSSRHNGEVGYTSTSVELIEQIRMLLLNIGILSKLYRDPRQIREFHKKDGTVYQSNLTGALMIRLSTIDSLKFYDRIGFRIERKQANIAKLPPPKEMAYFVRDHFINLYRKYGSVGRYNSIRKLLRPGYVGTIGKARAALLYWSDYDGDSDYIFLKERLDEHFKFKNRIVWLPVTDLSYSRSRLCDIEVAAEDHIYIANGFISHNSQVARTVILAYIKKENRDRKNGPVFQSHLENRTPLKSRILDRFLAEATELCKFNKDHLRLLAVIKQLYIEDEKPSDGLIAKLAARSGLSRATVTDFLKILRLRSHDFTDSPINEENDADRKLDLRARETENPED